MTLGIGLVGAGYMARRHAEAFARIPGVRVSAVVGRDGERSARAADLAGALRAREAASLDALLDSDEVQAVVVATPTPTHRDVALRALAAGKHVLVETPMARDLADARAMVAAQALDGPRLQVALLGRVAVPGAWVREQVLAGRVGRPMVVTTARLAPGTSGAHHGDALEEILLFDLDWLRLTFGAPKRVRATAVVGPTGRIDHVEAELDWGEVRGHAAGSYLLRPGRPLVVTASVLGTAGELAARLEHAVGRPPDVHLALHRPGEASKTRSDPGRDPIVIEDEHFVGVVLGARDPDHLGAEEALRTLELAEALRTSIARDAWVAPAA